MAASKRTSTDRRFTGSGSRPDLRSIRQKEAKERQEYYDTLTPAQKVEALDLKFGPGKGATKQRIKLATQPGKKKAA